MNEPTTDPKVLWVVCGLSLRARGGVPLWEWWARAFPSPAVAVLTWRAAILDRSAACCVSLTEVGRDGEPWLLIADADGPPGNPLGAERVDPSDCDPHELEAILAALRDVWPDYVAAFDRHPPPAPAEAVILPHPGYDHPA